MNVGTRSGEKLQSPNLLLLVDGSLNYVNQPM